MKRLLAVSALAVVLGGAGTLAVHSAHAQTPANSGSSNTAKAGTTDTPEANDVADTATTKDQVDTPDSSTAKDVPEVGDTKD